MQSEIPANRENHRYIHSIRENYGTWGARFAPDVVRFADKIGATSLLDYGCGKGLLARYLAKERPDLVVAQFDPGIPEHDVTPEPADLVVCTDVIPLVGAEYLSPLLDNLDRLTRKGLFIVIPIYRRDRPTPDYHSDMIFMEPEEWRAELDRRWPGGSHRQSRVGGNRLQYTWVRNT